MPVGLLTLRLSLPGCVSLKDKRSRIKPLLARLHREFNLSVAELARQDVWDETIIGCAVLSSDAVHNQQMLQQIGPWIEHHWPDVSVMDEKQESIF
jgi:hypothetical protein